MTTTAGDIRTRIKSDLIINSTDYDTQIIAAIQSALRQLRGKRYWFLKEIGTLTLLSGASSVALPDDYSAPYEFELINNGTRCGDGFGFDYLTFDRLKREYWLTSPLQTTQPVACATFGSLLYVSCLANDNYSIPITYYKQDVTLPDAGDTSVWFDDGYDVVRTLAQFIFKRDSLAFTVGEEDGNMYARALDNLDITHVAKEAAR